MTAPIEAVPVTSALSGGLAAAAYDAMVEHVAVLDERGTILLVNKAWRRFAERMGATSDFLGQNYLETCDAPIAAEQEGGREAAAGMRRVLAGEIEGFDLEYPCQPPGEPSRWYRMRVNRFAVNPEAPPRLLVVHEDITQRHETEERLRESEHRLRLALEASGTGMWDWEIGTDRVRWSPECCAIHGVNGSSCVNTATEFKTRIYSEDLPRVWAAIGKAIEERTKYECEFRILRADGQTRWIADRGRAFYDEQGRPDRMIGTITDITPRKEAEHILRESEHRLLLALEASDTGMWEWDVRTQNVSWSAECYRIHGLREDEFDGTAAAFDRTLHPEDRERVWTAVNAATQNRTRYECEFRIVRPDGEVRWVANVGRALYDDYDQRTRMIGTIRDITAHKRVEAALRRSNQELQRFAWAVSHDLKEPLRGVGTLARFMLQEEVQLSPQGGVRLQRIGALCDRLTEMINALLDYARSGGEPRNEPCDLEGIVRQSVDKLAEVLSAGRVELTIEPGLPRVTGDPALLERVFANLIANAVKYNRAEIKRIWIGQEDGAVYIRDNGVGISPRHHERIFELFTRIPGGPSGEGIGLGLALVKSIIEAHGGEISVKSAPGEGSTFYIRFASSNAVPRGGDACDAREGVP